MPATMRAVMTPALPMTLSAGSTNLVATTMIGRKMIASIKV